MAQLKPLAVKPSYTRNAADGRAWPNKFEAYVFKYSRISEISSEPVAAALVV